MPLLLPFRDKFSFPVGCAPGFNPTHPASGSINSSAVMVTPRSMINVSSGVQITRPSGGFFAMHGIIGPCANTSSAATRYIDTTVNPVAGSQTMAGIVMWTAAATGGYCAIVSLDAPAGNGVAFAYNVGSINAFVNSGAVSHDFLSVALNVPYFVAISIDSSNTWNAVATNLMTGQIRAATKFATATVPSAGTGICHGNSYNHNQPLNGYLAVSMYSNKGMTLADMLQWAADPWSYWYPDNTDDEIVGIIAAASSAKFRRTLSQLGTRIGARQTQYHDNAELS